MSGLCRLQTNLVNISNTMNSQCLFYLGHIMCVSLEEQLQLVVVFEDIHIELLESGLEYRYQAEYPGDALG